MDIIQSNSLLKFRTYLPRRQKGLAGYSYRASGQRRPFDRRWTLFTICQAESIAVRFHS